MKVLRTIVLILTLLITLVPAGQAQVAPARITAFTDSMIGNTRPEQFGAAEGLGFYLSNPLLPNLIQQTHTQVLRCAGIFSEYYDWEANNYDGVWYVDWLDTTIRQSPIRFGTDSIARLCESLGMEPVLGVNIQINDPAKAGRWVEYCNGDTSTPMGRIRAQRGHPAPYNVRYWVFGNETDLAGQTLPGLMTFYRHFGKPFSQWTWRDSVYITKAQYAALVPSYADSMRAHSPVAINIIAPSLAYDLSWIGPVLGPNASKINFVDVHSYPAPAETTMDTTAYKHLLAASDYPVSLDARFARARDSINRYRGSNPCSLAVLEYNAGGVLRTNDPLWSNYLDGLYIADALGHILRSNIPLACSYCLYYNRSADLAFPNAHIRGDTTSRRMASYVFQLYHDYFGNNGNLQGLVKTVSNSTGQGNGLEAYAMKCCCYHLDLMVVNKNLDTAYATTIAWPGYRATSNWAEGWDIQNDTTLAAPWNGTKGIVPLGTLPSGQDSMVYTFSKASVTLLRIWAPDAVEASPSSNPESRGFSLAILSPTPSRSGVRLAFSVPPETKGRLAVYNTLGEVVENLWAGQGGWERKVLDWKPGTIPAGVYFLKLESGGKTVVRKAVLVK